MSIWIISQVLLFLMLGGSVALLWARAMREPKDDPRLSRGLQLLQSKISVLEDLSDRTEMQVSQLSALMEQKVIEIQNKIHEADRQVQRVQQAIEKSLDVAQIFQDKIPHREIIDRENTVKYVKAARMAHDGKTTLEIMQEVDIPESELELIVKMNREKLMFSEEALPEWIRQPNKNLREQVALRQQTNSVEQIKFQTPQFEINETEKAPKTQPTRNMGDIFDIPQTNQVALKKLDEEFRRVSKEREEKIPVKNVVDNIFETLKANGLFMEEVESKQTPNKPQEKLQNEAMDYTKLVDETIKKAELSAKKQEANAPKVSGPMAQANRRSIKQSNGATGGIKPVEFPRIQTGRYLE